jgi:23S rRNA (uracil-5-)-methyltransferase RumA
LQENIEILPIIASPLIDWYRNKVEFSFWKYISNKENIQEHFNVWFHKQWSFSQIQDVDWCILTDDLTNNIYKDIKDYCKKSWLPVYDSKPQTWFFRHILIRRSFFTNQVMIIFWYNPKYIIDCEDTDSCSGIVSKIDKLEVFLKELAVKYSEIKSIYFSINDNKADIAIWNLKLIYGEKYITEDLLWLTFKISPKSFFQTNSYGAEVLYSKVLEFAHKENMDKFTVLDLYAWTWTIGMIFAKNKAKEVWSIELVEQASKDWEENAKSNSIDNMIFVNKKVEDFLTDYVWAWKKADLLIIDPPRSGMHPDALPNIIKFWTNQIIYVSCNPSTLSRDLEYILKNSDYMIEKVNPVDMFPHTHHIETIVSLIRK